ncbi:protein cordon-bleu-like [Parambassis ranga]|uniref:Protein cordon-bleu-like n=1 Tax=Parambassis ranga TaxID=210632 RepID=A0A6P7I4D6_9TELE|nr:protein cordon-bleu-like [Parambassis ranga]XP_028255330.1 protein cordon-bleu-like [Parambassis ranga]
MDEQVNPLEREHAVCVVLPGGLEKSATVHGSKPVMDLLVTLCASHHLNPSDYTVEVLSPNKNNISFKPNCPVGLLEADRIVLKPKGVEEKSRRPYMPEATVRLLVNYNISHKTVVRVNPRLPLETLLPLVCDKCEFQLETTVLLKDCESRELLDLSKSLNEHGLREVFAKDLNQRQPDKDEAQPSEVVSPPPLHRAAGPKREKKQKENSGFFSLFRRRKKKQEVDRAASAPSAPGLSEQVDVSVKKRRAPPPPMGASQSVPSNLSSCHLTGAQRSVDSTLRSTKRRAPAPPCAASLQEQDGEVNASVTPLNAVGELGDSDESDSVNLSPFSSPSPRPSQPSSSFSRPSLAHLHEVADPYLPSFRGKDLSDARSALAKVLTSSVSRGTLVRRLKNSATFPKFQNGSPFLSSRCSDNGVAHAELESVLNSNLPTASDWEDPVQRSGLTTFKVVPLKKVQDPDLVSLDVPDQCQTSAEDAPESKAYPEVYQAETEEETGPPDRQSITPSHSPQPSPPPSHVSPPPLQDVDSAGTPPSEDTSEGLQGVDSAGTPPSEDTYEGLQGLDSAGTPPSEDTYEGLQGVDSAGTPPSEDTSEGLQGVDSAGTPPSEDTYEGLQGLDSAGTPPSEDTYEGLQGVDSAGTPPSEEEDNTEKLEGEEEEEEPEVTLPVPPDEDFNTEGHIRSEDQRRVCQSSSPNMSVCSSGAEEKKVEEEEQEDEQEEERKGEVLGEQEEKEEEEEKVKEDKQEEERKGEVLGEQEEEEEEELSFPPPPPPVFFDEDAEVMEGEEAEAGGDTTAFSLPQTPPLHAWSEAHQEDSALAEPEQPAERKSAAPSRFAQAVAMAVQRSRLQGRSTGPSPRVSGGPCGAPESPPSSTYQYGA